MSDYRQNRYSRENIQRRVAAHVRFEEKMKNSDTSYLIDAKLKNQGKLFYESGGVLEDAPCELRNNNSFIEGYENAIKRRNEAYNLGFKKFINGISLDDISDIYKNNVYFMQGYRDAHDLSLMDGIDWKNITDEFEANIDDNAQGRSRR